MADNGPTNGMAMTVSLGPEISGLANSKLAFEIAGAKRPFLVVDLNQEIAARGGHEAAAATRAHTKKMRVGQQKKAQRKANTAPYQIRAELDQCMDDPFGAAAQWGDLPAHTAAVRARVQAARDAEERMSERRQQHQWQQPRKRLPNFPVRGPKAQGFKPHKAFKPFKAFNKAAPAPAAGSSWVVGGPAPRPQSSVPKMRPKLLISGLAPSVTRSDLVEIFGPLGTLVSAQMHHGPDGAPLGTALLHYATAGEARRAYIKYSGMNLDNSPMCFHVVSDAPHGRIEQ
eukprot:c5728_g1_i1.p1 GENE.c5728_g1_i1~~c5728_g1_i1.p1  ORF type:complete len:286 (-),score=33.70 c5728_g1_i1:200-1057(-)